MNGVGYRVLVAASTASLLSSQKQVTVYTYSHIREDLFELYGFLTQDDLQLFEQLISVSGVGPKTALGVFAVGKTTQIKEAIITGDVSFFTGVPRLGKKNAQKLIIELKNKLGSQIDLDIMGSDGKSTEEVVIALKTFGFTTGEITDALRALDGKGNSVEETIKLALKQLGR